MRSSLLILVALVAVLCMIPFASADANVTLYSDSGCSNPIGDPMQLPLSSSMSCQTVPQQTISYYFYCGVDGSKTNFSFSVWNSTTDCSGDALFTITSDDTAGGCAMTNIVSQGQQFSAYAKITCSKDMPMVKQSPVAVQKTVNAATEGVVGWIAKHRASTKSLFNDHINTIIKLLTK